MKKISLVAILFSALAVSAQQSAPTVETSKHTIEPEPATYSDVYCAGFVSREAVPKNNIVVSGFETPSEALYAQKETVFLSGGGFEEGKSYAVIRELTDPNRYELFPGQTRALKSMGQPYADIGHVKVVAIRGDIAIAQIELSCQAMTLGDIVVPIPERQLVMMPLPSPERFPAPGTSDLTARIILAKEFDSQVGYRNAVYINAGSGQGVKVGDRFRALRSYDPKKIDPVDAISYDYHDIMDDTQKNVLIPNGKRQAQLPSRVVGELVVVGVTPTSSTLLVSNALETIDLGDYVEREKAQ
ncbi:MAG TPA: hypothetical protein VKW78_06560 [Terriglobales bacterium]|nr:hypothetical protein [Terriglobales bacterium]